MYNFTELYEKTRYAVCKRDWPSTTSGIITTDWQRLLRLDANFPLMLAQEKPEHRHADGLEHLRQHIKEESRITGRSVGSVIADVNIAASKKRRFLSPYAFNIRRAAALKVLYHLYFVHERGAQGVWVYAPPTSNADWANAALATNRDLMVNKLDASDEYYTQEQRNTLKVATQMALDWCMTAQSVGYTWTINCITDWFVGLSGDNPAGHANERVYYQQVGPKIQKMINMLNKNTLIYSFHPDMLTDDAERLLGFVYPAEKLDVIYIKNTFGAYHGLSAQWNCALIILHEVTHRAFYTKDHSYGFQGLKPSKTGLTSKQAFENADSWAYFIADLALKLNDNEKTRVLKHKR